MGNSGLEQSYKEAEITIRTSLLEGKRRFAIFPYGKMGHIVKDILNYQFCIDEEILLDNGKKNTEKGVYSVESLMDQKYDGIDCLFACNREDEVYFQLKETLERYLAEEHIIEVFPRISFGKYSDRPMLDPRAVKSVGAFCSFAEGVSIVLNHPVDRVTSHHFIFADNYSARKQDECNNLIPKGSRLLSVNTINKKTVIGNDVWIGRNVTIIAGVRIGNGVIIGAQSVVTHDIPDYAVAVGVPARIIRFRASENEIKKMNEIQWWNWEDEKIRKHFDIIKGKIENFIKYVEEEG